MDNGLEWDRAYSAVDRPDVLPFGSVWGRWFGIWTWMEMAKKGNYGLGGRMRMRMRMSVYIQFAFHGFGVITKWAIKDFRDGLRPNFENPLFGLSAAHFAWIWVRIWGWFGGEVLAQISRNRQCDETGKRCTRFTLQSTERKCTWVLQMILLFYLSWNLKKREWKTLYFKQY